MTFTVPRELSAFPLRRGLYLPGKLYGKSNYHSLQTSLSDQLSWLYVDRELCLVESLDNSSDGEDFVVNAAQPQNSTRRSLEYGPSNFNIPHRFVWIAATRFPR